MTTGYSDITSDGGYDPRNAVNEVTKKEWVGLTDDERRDIFDSCEREDRGYVAAMVEAKLKEKNT